MAAVSFTRDIPTRSLLAGNVGHLTAFEHIQSITVGSLGASSVTFSEIPQDYRHLQIRITSRTTGSATNYDVIGMRLNGDSGNNYSSHYLYGTGSSAFSSAATSQSYMNVWASASNGMTANIFGSAVVDILDYANTVKNKTVRILGGVDTNGNGGVFLTSNLWMSTAAITSIVFPTGLASNSTFSLYGIR